MKGSVRGKKLSGPKGLDFRPTTGRVKEAIFSYLSNDIIDARVLDCFAGTGSLGIEALSRSAQEVVFIDQSIQSMRLLKKNIDLCAFQNRSKIIRGDVFTILKRLGLNGEMFDYVFADPPFKKNLRSRIVFSVEKSGILKKGGLLIIEHEAHDQDEGEHHFRLIKQRRYGHCVVSIYG